VEQTVSIANGAARFRHVHHDVRGVRVMNVRHANAFVESDDRVMRATTRVRRHVLRQVRCGR
jgi:hypothetical protein